MPEQPPSKRRPLLDAPTVRSGGLRYAELHAKTNFSFLEGASHPDELVNRAAELGYYALAVTDRQSLAGVVRAHAAAKAAGLKLLIGAEVLPDDAPAAVLLATDRASYGRLSKLLTVGRRRAAKGECELAFDDVAAHAEGLLACVLGGNARALADYREIFGDRCYALAELHRGPDDRRQLAERIAVARLRASARGGGQRRALSCAAAPAAGRRVDGDSRRHDRGRSGRTTVRQRRAVSQAARRTVSALCRRARAAAADGRDRRPHSLFARRVALRVSRRAGPAGTTPVEHLARLAWQGAQQRYPGGVPDKVRGLIEHELQLIGELHYEAYFLTVWDLVRFARERGILCQGRGSAANSAVCYCLGVTSVDPERMDLLFERFVSRERNEAPDIDVDFEHERREEVLQYLYEKYGRERAGMTAEVITYRPRSAVRDVGKALGLSLDRVDALAKRLEHFRERARAGRALPRGGHRSRRGRWAGSWSTLVGQLVGFPRHLSQHTGGMVMTRGPLCELVPIENAAMPDRTVIQWNKDDLDELGILKVDCLALGMLTAIRKCFDLIERHYGRRLTLASVPAGRPGGLRHDPPGRHDGRVPDREPGPDEHAAPAAAALLLRPGDRGGDRPARADPGQHGPSLPAAPQRRRSRSPIPTRRSARCWKRRSACRCFRSRRCGWPWWRPASRPARPTSSAARWAPGAGRA